MVSNAVSITNIKRMKIQTSNPESMMHTEVNISFLFKNSTLEFSLEKIKNSVSYKFDEFQIFSTKRNCDFPFLLVLVFLLR